MAVRDRIDQHHIAATNASPQIVIVYLIMNALVDGFFPVLNDFDDKIDALEDDILKPPTEAQLGVLFDMKRSLMNMRKVIAPQRDMMASINAGVSDVPGMTDEAARYFRDLYDHLIRLADLVDSYRDLLSSVMDTHLSTVSNRLNVVMKQLAIIATVFLPLSFLTGFFGQNFTYLVNHLHRARLDVLGHRHRHRGRRRRPCSTCSSSAAAGWAARRSRRRVGGPADAPVARRRGPRTRSTTPRSRRAPGSPTACAGRRGRGRPLALAEQGARSRLRRPGPEGELPHSFSSRCQARRRASVIWWVSAAISASRVGSPSAMTSAARNQP